VPILPRTPDGPYFPVPSVRRLSAPVGPVRDGKEPVLVQVARNGLVCGGVWARQRVISEGERRLLVVVAAYPVERDTP
jgi:hypothetical protein